MGWEVIVLLAIGSVALGTVISTLAGPIISFFAGAVSVILCAYTIAKFRK